MVLVLACTGRREGGLAHTDDSGTQEVKREEVFGLVLVFVCFGCVGLGYVGLGWDRVGWGGLLDSKDVLGLMHGRSRMSIDRRIPTSPGRSMSGFHRPGRRCLYQALSAVRCLAGFHEVG